MMNIKSHFSTDNEQPRRKTTPFVSFRKQIWAMKMNFSLPLSTDATMVFQLPVAIVIS